MASKSKRKIWLIVGAAGLAVAIAVVTIAYFYSKRQREAELALVAEVLSGDAVAFAELKTKGIRAVTLLEEFIQLHHAVDAKSIDASVEQLASADPRIRQFALAKLTLLPESATDLLKRHLESTGDIRVEADLKGLTLNRAKTQPAVGEMLSEIYTLHFDVLFSARQARLQTNCHNPAAQMFFAYAPFEKTWATVATNTPDAQLRFLLLRAFTGRDDLALTHLEKFYASDLLRLAAQTWWPVEIEPLQKDGAYGWTTRAAAVNGNVATHVLRLSVKDPPRNKPERGAEWLHFDRWFRWTYIFQYAKPILNNDAVVFAESIVREQNQSWRTPGSRPKTTVTNSFWLPEKSETGLIGAGRCDTVRGVPKTARLPIVAITKEESISWHLGAAYEWSRPFIPVPVQSRVRFSLNKYPAPEIISKP